MKKEAREVVAMQGGGYVIWNEDKINRIHSSLFYRKQLTYDP